MTGQQSRVRIAFIAEDLRDAWLAAFPQVNDTTVYTVRGLARGQWFYAEADSVEQLKAAFGGSEKLLRAAKDENQ